jgi:hypothetical protein
LEQTLEIQPILEDVSLKLGRKEVELSIANLTIAKLQQQLADANAVIAKHGMATAPDGT